MPFDKMGIRSIGRKSSSVRNDFALYNASKIEEGETEITLQLGVKNGLVSVTGSLSFDGITGLPAGMTEGGTPPYVEEVEEGDIYAWIELTLDTTDVAPKVTYLEIKKGDTYPTSDASKLCIPLGDFAVNDTTKVVSIGSGVNGIGSQVVEACRNPLVDSDDEDAWHYSYGPL